MSRKINDSRSSNGYFPGTELRFKFGVYDLSANGGDYGLRFEILPDYGLTRFFRQRLNGKIADSGLLWISAQIEFDNKGNRATTDEVWQHDYTPVNSIVFRMFPANTHR
jgi:hypothetical protein